MLKVLSIQSDVLGNKTYCESLRRYFADFTAIDLTACWYHEDRSLVAKLVNKLVRLPVVPSKTNLDIRRARAEWGYGYISKQLAVRKLAQRSYDVLHFHSQVQSFGSVALMRRIPTVVSMDMTAYQIAREAAPPYRWTHMPSIHMERKVLEAAAHIVTFSEWARQSVIHEHGLPEQKVTAILPGTRLETFDPPNYAVRELPRILFVGGDFQRKGGWDLLQVFSEHLSRQAELHLVTNQPLPTMGRNVFVHAGIEAFSQPWHQVFRDSDIFAMPSYAEALGHVFQEGAGYGLALIGSNVGAISEMVREGQNGFIVEPGNRGALLRALRRLLEDAPELARMRRNSEKIAIEQFSALRNFRKLADLMEGLVHKH